MPETVDVGRQGRIVIPAALRRQLGIKTGTCLLARIEDDHLILEPRRAVIQALKKSFRGAPRDAIERLLRERREKG